MSDLSSNLNVHKKVSITVAVFITLAGIFTLSALGLYFDGFLKKSFLETTETRMRHAFQRVELNILGVEKSLLEGIVFIEKHEPTMASIDLINNYEDKNNYNTFLIDEEKKTIAEELLKRVRLSFNDDIALYNQRGELIAYVARGENGYALNIISHADGRTRLLRRHENEFEYHEHPLGGADRDLVALQHAALYAQKRIEQGSVVTYQYTERGLRLTSHLSLFYAQDGEAIAHIEMSRTIDPQYVAALSADLDMTLEVRKLNAGAEETPPSLFDAAALAGLKVVETELNYAGRMRIDSVDGPIIVDGRLERDVLVRTLAENRKHLVTWLIGLALLTLISVHYFIKWRLERPLGKLMAQIQKIEARDYSSSPPLNTDDELEVVSRSINQLAETVRERETSLQGSKRELEYLSNHDVLTHLPNRRYWDSQLESALESAASESQKLAMFFIDLDQFKQVNDTQGHNVGDALLAQVAARLKGHAPENHVLARIGGDEFNIIVNPVDGAEELEAIAEGYLNLFSTPFPVHGQEIGISASIGIAIYPMDGKDKVSLLKCADLAMYSAKEKGRNNYSFFSSDLSAQMKKRAEMSRAMKQAITDGNQFRLCYQPKICTLTGSIVSIEALIRWESPELGMVSPADFIPLAEEQGLIVPIGEWVLEKACRDFSRLVGMGINLQHVSVNVSNVQLSNYELMPKLLRILKDTGVAPKQLELEITESYIATNIQEAIQTLKQFRQMGIGLAVDDFGTGYSAMSYLQTLPVTRLKVDKAFVDGLPNDRNSVAIARAIISLAKSFGLQLTAEGVEHQGQLDFLVSEGCEEIQGYYYSKPLDFDDLVQYCRVEEVDNVVMLHSPEGA
ncbi:putative bifunctional diguanylate cyclase/phosphodiesterase [Pontibacterium sp.]|uniref:putative bifunctional diguanylate cyclase/phosphodiesterase n=3 Tax=Pontibacterium sp. TaxID=2036026 RepID=UPI0035140A63